MDQVSADEKWQLSTAFAYTTLETLTSMRLGSARASGVPLLGPTLMVGSEGSETKYNPHGSKTPNSIQRCLEEKKQKQTESIALSSDSEIETESKNDPNSCPRIFVVQRLQPK